MGYTGLILVVVIGVLTIGRDASAQSADKNQTSISTSDGGCRLFIEDIVFTKYIPDTSRGKGTKTIVYVDGVNLVLNETGVDEQCGANVTNSIIRLDYIDIPYSTPIEGKTTALENFTLTWHINYKKGRGWWSLDELDLDVVGDITEGKYIHINWSGAVLQDVAIGAPEKFGYACRKPNQLIYTLDKDHGPFYQLQFVKLHLQPFAYSKGNFTDNVDDCVAFFSAGVWMALSTLLIFVLIILSGVVMLSNMPTVNRFDDPKDKPLLIVPRD